MDGKLMFVMRCFALAIFAATVGSMRRLLLIFVGALASTAWALIEINPDDDVYTPFNGAATYRDTLKWGVTQNSTARTTYDDIWTAPINIGAGQKATVTVTVTSKQDSYCTGYLAIRWNGESLQSLSRTDESYTFTVNSTGTLVLRPDATGHGSSGWATTIGVTLSVSYSTGGSASSYVVTFNPLSGSVSPTSKVVNKGAAIGTLPTPTRSGYVFDGWYTKYNGVAAYGTKVTGSTKVNANTTLYALWITARSVIFRTNYAGSNVWYERKVKTGSSLGDMPTPTRSGYAFDGWYTEASGGTKITASIKIHSDVTYYAHWVPAITTSLFPGCKNMGTVSGGGVVAAGKKVTLKATANKGYVFAGWYLGDDPLEGDVDYRTATYPYVSTGEPTDILAKFVAIEYDVSSLGLVNITNCTVEAGCAFTKDMTPHVVSHSIPKLAVTGLPAGLKYDAKTMKISGVCTKPGVYAVKVAATNASVKKATDDTTRTFTINVKLPKLTLTVGSLPEMSVDDPSSETNLLVGAYIEWPINAISPSATVASMKVSGLPAGLKFTAKDVVDPKTKQVTVKANTIYGRPTAASKMDKYGKPVPSVVKIAVTTTGKTTINYTVNVTIDALPNWLTGTYVGVGNIVENNRYEVSCEYAGTVSADGKLSATVDYIYLDLNDGTVVKMRGTLSSPGYSAHYDSITKAQAVGWIGSGNSALADELVGAPCFYYKDVAAKIGTESTTVNLIVVADDYNDSGDKIGVILGVENAALLSDYAGEFVVQDSWKRTDLADKPVFASGTVRKKVQIPYSSPLYKAGVRSLDVLAKSASAATVKVTSNFYGYTYEETMNAKIYPLEWKDGAFECLAVVKSPELILPVLVTLTPDSSGKISGSGITIDLE